MTLDDIEAFMAKGLDYVQALAPLAGALAGPAGIAIGETISKVAATASAVLTAVEADASIIASGDPTRIRDLQAQIQAENDTLAGQIDAS